MNTPSKAFPMASGWPLVLRDLGTDARTVLRRAQLPEDLFARPAPSLGTPEYFRFWSAMEQESAEPLFPLRLTEVIKSEAFDPPIFAALCSSNLTTAARRLSHYKRLIAPMRLQVEQDSRGLSIEFEWIDRTTEAPASLVVFELVFLVQLARVATRERVVPLRVQTPQVPELQADYERFLGTRIERSEVLGLTFSTFDAQRPFLTANDGMWQAFEPVLRRRLAELDESATCEDRVRATLLEALPSGESSMDEVSRRLGISKRTLQRRLRTEGTSYQSVLNATRESLARYYLAKTSLSGAEISYLLGFADPNSFFRAFHDWTGETTEQVRLVHAH